MFNRWTHYINTPWLYFAALVLGFLLALHFDFAHDSPWLPLGYVCGVAGLLGYLYLIRTLPPKRAMLFGYLFGLAFFGWGLNWVYISMAMFGGAPFIFAIFANAAVVAFLSLYWLVGSLLIVRLGQTSNQRLLIAPAVIVLLEWLRSFVLIGFPWLSLGYAWVDTFLARAAERLGVFGVSFLILWLLALWLVNGKRWLRLTAAVVAMGVFTPISFNAPTAAKASATVTLIQGNMPVITEYNTERMNKNLVKYRALTEAALANSHADVVIWPEGGIPHFYVEALEFFDEMHALQQAQQFDLITGIASANWETKDIYNSIVLQEKSQQHTQFYHKSHLLPFGEYIPFRTVFAFFREFVHIPRTDFARGDAIQAPFVAGGLTLAPSICYEALFGNEIRQSATGADVLLNVSNDTWFGQSKAQIQHLNIARMRAIENQKMLVRATNDGRTAIVAMDGRVTHSIAPFADGVLTAEITAHDTVTWYAKLGDFLIVLICLTCIALTPIAFKHFSRSKVAAEQV